MLCCHITRSYGNRREGHGTSSSSILRSHPITTASTLASYRSPSDPVLRANPFPKVTDLICRLPLPTLFYQLEAIHLGDLLRLSGTIEYENQLAPSNFQGQPRALQTPQEPWRFTGTSSVSLAEPVPRSPTLKKKRKLSLELPVTFSSSFALPPLTIPKKSHIPVSLFRNINRIPFRHL